MFKSLDLHFLIYLYLVDDVDLLASLPLVKMEMLVLFLTSGVPVFQVPLEGFKALQGISGPQRLQIHKAYGAPERLPSAHTWLEVIYNAFYYFKRLDSRW